MLQVAALQGTAQIEELQRALKNLAQAAQWPAVDPGAITGEIDFNLMTSVSTAATGELSVSGGLKAALDLALTYAMTKAPDEALNYFTTFVTEWAPQLTLAVNGLAQRYLGVEEVPPEAQPEPAMSVKQRMMSFTTQRYVSPGTLTPVVKPIREYPIGSITTQARDGAWRVAVPKTALDGVMGLGQTAVDIFEASKSGDYAEVTPSTEKPIGPLVVDEPTFKKKITPWYKNWKILVPLGGVAAVGTYFAVRRL
jgi:hypothetical protein